MNQTAAKIIIATLSLCGSDVIACSHHLTGISIVLKLTSGREHARRLLELQRRIGIGNAEVSDRMDATSLLGLSARRQRGLDRRCLGWKMSDRIPGTRLAARERAPFGALIDLSNSLLGFRRHGLLVCE